jgi:hypothetical protein
VRADLQELSVIELGGMLARKYLEKLDLRGLAKRVAERVANYGEGHLFMARPEDLCACGACRGARPPPTKTLS